MDLESGKPQDSATLNAAQAVVAAVIGARREQPHTAQMAASWSAVEQTLMARGLDAKRRARMDITGLTPEGTTFESEITRILAVTRAYFQMDLAALVPVRIDRGGSKRIISRRSRA